MSHFYKSSVLGFTAALLSISSIGQSALAQTAPSAAEPAAAVVTPGPFTANLTLTND